MNIDLTGVSKSLNGAVSMAELERRWAAIRAQMKREGIDALVAQNNNDHMGATVKYLTDIPATNGYPMTVVFPIDDDMSVVRQGPRGGVVDLEHEGNGLFRGVKRLLLAPNFATVYYDQHVDADLALSALTSYASATIGLVGPQQMSHAMASRLRDQLPDARFVDATQLVDAIKAQRSPEELALIRATARLQDDAINAAFAAAEPGMRESDVAAVALYNCQRAGAEQGIFMMTSGKPGTPMHLNPRHMQSRVLEEGDQLVLLVETNGPGGLYTEIGRTLYLGDVPAQAEDEFAFTLEARAKIVDRLAPGASLPDIFAEYNAFMQVNGRPPEKRLVGHAQGYDMVERPLIRDDETMPLSVGMNMAVHPIYVHNGWFSWICDNYIVQKNARAERIHTLPETLMKK